MNKFLVHISLAALFFITSPLSLSAEEGKLSLSVTHSGEDIAGKKLAFALREAVRGSNGYLLTTGPSALIRVSLTTLDPDNNPSDAWTVASIVVTMRNLNQFDDRNPQTWYPIYLTSSVVTSGINKVDGLADAVLVMVDEAVEEYKVEARNK